MGANMVLYGFVFLRGEKNGKCIRHKNIKSGS